MRLARRVAGVDYRAAAASSFLGLGTACLGTGLDPIQHTAMPMTRVRRTSAIVDGAPTYAPW